MEASIGTSFPRDVSPSVGWNTKQFFVFSNAGKPIYAYQMDEDAVSGIMATAKAILSVAQENGDSLRYIQTGAKVVAFLDRNPLYLVAATTLGEPPVILRMQLSLLHGQILSFLTGRSVENILTKNPGYDVRRLLDKTDVVFDSLIESFLENPSSLLGAYRCFPLKSSVRIEVINELRIAIASCNATFGFLLSDDSVVAACTSPDLRGPALQQWDILLLTNFVRSNKGLRQTETFTPLCLPGYNSSGHFHAYINFLREEASLVLVLLVGSSLPNHMACVLSKQKFVERLEEKQLMEKLSRESNQNIEETLYNVDLHAARDVMQQTIQKARWTLSSSSGQGAADEDTIKITDGLTNDMPKILHFAYKVTKHQQYIETSFDSLIEFEVAERKQMQREIVVAYGQLRASMFDHAKEHVIGPLQTLRFEQRNNMAFVVILNQETEFYSSFFGTVEKKMTVALVEHLRKWLEKKTEFFFQLK